MHSESLDQLVTALVKAQAAFPTVQKNATNPHYGSRYADLETIWNAVRPALTANGLAIVQTTAPSKTEHSVDVVTTLLHISGQWIAGALTVPYGVEGKKGEERHAKVDPQGMGIAITYGRRYGLSAILSIVTEDDTDGEHGRTPQRQAPQRAPSRPAPRTERPQDGPPSQIPDGIPLDPPLCPVCGGAMWDNRDRAKGTKAPKWKCKNATWDKETRTAGGCPGVVWHEHPDKDDAYMAAWADRLGITQDSQADVDDPNSDDEPF